MMDFLTSQLGVSIILAIVVYGAIQGAVAYCIYFERKIAAWTQDRIGPNRVGPLGLFQPIADGVKFLMKEDVIPGHVDRALFVLAPALMFVVAGIGFAAIPWGGQVMLEGTLIELQIATPDIGLLYILAVGSMGVYGVVLGGWASNNKYSFYGAMRATAQMISYEIPLGLCILVVVATMGTLRLEEITAQQVDGYWFGFLPKWNVFLHPLAFLVLFITSLAEANRTPFDLAECEQELVGGYHTEYSALKFGLFFLAEYAHMITASALMAVLFLGGWHMPFVPWAQSSDVSWLGVVVKMGVLSAKIAAFLFVMMWIRWTLPRFRFDQLMRLAWKGLIPMTLAMFVLTVVLLYFGLHRTWWATASDAFVLAGAVLYMSLTSFEITGRQRNMARITGPGWSPIAAAPAAEGPA